MCYSPKLNPNVNTVTDLQMERFSGKDSIIFQNRKIISFQIY